jgi:D-alanyl-D-alanine carboxypeptidase/D-alanyl-D-alanine-endopeptidase (penicillin-binding protein 4)
VGHGFLDPDGVWRGDVVLRGGGDPTLDRDAIALLAKRMQAAGVLRVDGSVLGDESLFDTLRGSYDSGGAYDVDIGGVLGALTVSRGFARDGRPAAEAARRLARALRAAGVRVEERSGSGRAPADGRLLASVKSPPLRDLISLINVPSDNFMAEVLVKALGARSGAGGTTRAGIAVIGARIAQLGVHPEIVDGSGLSRVDRTTPRQVVRLLAKMHTGPYAVPFERSFAVAGRSGTLRRRMRGTAAQDRCSAKTGTLIGVSTLAGICRVAHRIQDHIATDIARYTPAAAAPTR